MKKILKRVVVVLAVFILGVGIYTGILFALDRDPIISDVRAFWVIDVHDLNAVTGLSDHVFVGRVVSNIGVTFPTDSHMPFTNYEIEVIEVIKGDLMPGIIIPAQKAGGPARFNLFAFLLTGGRAYHFIHENDFLPQAGNAYVFRASNMDNGIIDIARGPNAQHLLVQESEAMSDDIVLHVAYSDHYAAAVYAYENQVPFERERFPTPAEFRTPQE